jgi:hypothetical protein
MKACHDYSPEQGTLRAMIQGPTLVSIHCIGTLRTLQNLTNAIAKENKGVFITAESFARIQSKIDNL